jgi:hypothetical protein
MKFVSKFILEIHLACQGCVTPARGILLGLGLLFPLVNPETRLFGGNSRRYFLITTYFLQFL